MGFSRMLANMSSWGAHWRVDKAKESYNGTIYRLKSTCNKIQEICSSIENLRAGLDKKKIFIQSNNLKLRRLYTNRGLLNQLSQHDKDILGDYFNNKILLPNTNIEIKYMTGSDFHDGIWEDDSASNIGSTIATSITPGGFIFAHIFASEEIEKIQKNEYEVIQEINRLSSVIVKLSETESKLKKVDKAYDCLIGLCQK